MAGVLARSIFQAGPRPQARRMSLGDLPEEIKEITIFSPTRTSS